MCSGELADQARTVSLIRFIGSTAFVIDRTVRLFGGRLVNAMGKSSSSSQVGTAQKQAKKSGKGGGGKKRFGGGGLKKKGASSSGSRGLGIGSNDLDDESKGLTEKEDN